MNKEIIAMVYKCNICGYVYDEEKERKPFSELTECPVCENPPEQFILHTDYIFSISPDCRVPAKCINECKTVNPGGLQYKYRF